MSGFVDTNIFVRMLVRDDVDMARRCYELFQQAERGEIELVTSEAVVAETVYVLSWTRIVVPARKCQVRSNPSPASNSV